MNLGNAIYLGIYFKPDTHLFLAVLAALYLHMGLTESFTIHHSERLTRQCARIRSDKLQLPNTRRLEVTWDQITSNLLVYNLQLPYKYDGHHGRDGQAGHLDRDGHNGLDGQHV